MVNNRIKLLIFIGLLSSIFNIGNIFGQRNVSNIEFDSIYNKGLNVVNSDLNTSMQCLKKLEEKQKQLSPTQQAKYSFLRLKVIYADSEAVKALDKRMFAAPDSLAHYDALIYSAVKYLEKSMPDKAIHLLMRAIDSLAIGSEKADYCRINLCEAYRQKLEYKKGIDMLKEMLSGKSGLTDINRAFAYNRLAALYNESGYSTDSVIKYSELCISLSKKIDSKSNLGFSQNELCFQMMRKKQYENALELSIEAVKNFKEAKMIYSAMSTLINQSNIYIQLNKIDLAQKVIVDAINLCSIEENRNLFKRLYLQLAKIYKLKENYKDAYDLFLICYQLQNDFFLDRINSQINEQSAKYDLLAKEKKLSEEKQKNEFHKKQLTFIIIILIILCIAFVLSLFYIRLRRKEFIKQKLIEAVIETEETERKRIASDLHDGLGPLLSAAKLYFQAYIDVKDNDGKSDIESKLKDIIENAISDTSRISHNISPHILENYGLIVALENFISDININKNIHFDVSFEKLERFDLKEELTIYRTISELINNTIKHAQATLIIIKIFLAADGMLNLIYEDNGIGFSFEEKINIKNGIGLKNLENRIHYFKGNVVFESQPNNGTKATIKIPYKKLL